MMRARKARRSFGTPIAMTVVTIVGLACRSSSSGEPEPTLVPGRLATTWYAGGKDCAGQAPFRVHAYNNDFYILRQAACTNFEKPFLYLIFGREHALLLDTGAGRVDVAGVVDSIIRRRPART